MKKATKIIDITDKYVAGKNESKCENCIFYKMIDSGYGFCLRYPPKTIQPTWWKKVSRIEYQIVEWNRTCCGESELKFRQDKEIAL